MADPQRGEVWLDAQARPKLVLKSPMPDKLIGIDMCEIASLEPNAGFGGGQWVVPVMRSTENYLDSDMHVDCAFLMAIEPKALVLRIGHVDSAVLTRIDENLVQMTELADRNERNNRFARRDVKKHDYDVAISFAGADRKWANSLAKGLRDEGLRVFYDEYEKANLWGKDLVQHLDQVYRVSARFCMVLVSSHYAASLWGNHELKSALARSLIDNGEYLLPVRLDDTELPGLRPTVGYIEIKTLEDVSLAVELVQAKIENRNLISYAEFSAKWIQNVRDINTIWKLDCLAFCVDRRYFLDSEGLEYRVGISFGINRTTPRVGWMAPSEQSGPNVFGLHAIAVLEGTRLCLWDQWLDSLPAPVTDRLEIAVRDAYQRLARIDDSQYYLLASEISTLPELYISERYLLDEFDISDEIG